MQTSYYYDAVYNESANDTMTVCIINIQQKFDIVEVKNEIAEIKNRTELLRKNLLFLHQYELLNQLCSDKEKGNYRNVTKAIVDNRQAKL